MAEAIPVHIYMALDRSGSMRQLASDVIGGLNQFIADQKAKPGKCRFTLIQFDDQDPFEVVYDAVKISRVPELTEATYRPRGRTPLLDAEGRLIDRALQRAKERFNQNKKAEAIMFVTWTDGLENASKEWTYDKLTTAKKHCEEELKWAFLYLGVGHDAYAQSHLVGTYSTVSATPDSAGVAATYASAGAATDVVRKSAARGEHAATTDLLEGDEQK